MNPWFKTAETEERLSFLVIQGFRLSKTLTPTTGLIQQGNLTITWVCNYRSNCQVNEVVMHLVFTSDSFLSLLMISSSAAIALPVRTAKLVFILLKSLMCSSPLGSLASVILIMNLMLLSGTSCLQACSFHCAMAAIWMRWSNITTSSGGGATTFERSFLVAPTGVEIFRAALCPCPPGIDMLEGKEAVPCAFCGGVVMRSSQRYVCSIFYETIDPIKGPIARHHVNRIIIIAKRCGCSKRVCCSSITALELMSTQNIFFQMYLYGRSRFSSPNEHRSYESSWDHIHLPGISSPPAVFPPPSVEGVFCPVALTSLWLSRTDTIVQWSFSTTCCIVSPPTMV